jgi:hypothetical protein
LLAADAPIGVVSSRYVAWARQRQAIDLTLNTGYGNWIPECAGVLLLISRWHNARAHELSGHTWVSAGFSFVMVVSAVSMRGWRRNFVRGTIGPVRHGNERRRP